MHDSTRHEDAAASDATTASETPRVIPSIDEFLVIDKRTIDRGGYRIVKRVSAREEVVAEPLVAHTVHVEHRAIGRMLPSMEAPAPRQEGDTLIVSVVEEVLVTEKRLMLKEEIHITRTEAVTHHSQKFSLRSEDVVIERLEPGDSPAGETP